MDIANVDLEALVQYLDAHFRHAPPEGPVVGRTVLRDAVTARLECSQLEAEQTLDTLILRGRIALVRVPDGRQVWQIA